MVNRVGFEKSAYLLAIVGNVGGAGNLCMAFRFGGADMEEHINVFNRDIMIPLLRAIIRHENGKMPYTLEELQEGILLANE